MLLSWFVWCGSGFERDGYWMNVRFVNPMWSIICRSALHCSNGGSRSTWWFNVQLGSFNPMLVVLAHHCHSYWVTWLYVFATMVMLMIIGRFGVTYLLHIRPACLLAVLMGWSWHVCCWLAALDTIDLHSDLGCTLSAYGYVLSCHVTFHYCCCIWLGPWLASCDLFVIVWRLVQVFYAGIYGSNSICYGIHSH